MDTAVQFIRQTAKPLDDSSILHDPESHSSLEKYMNYYMDSDECYDGQIVDVIDPETLEQKQFIINKTKRTYSEILINRMPPIDEVDEIPLTD